MGGGRPYNAAPSSVPSDWKCPPENASEQKKLGWLREAIQQGDGYLRSQRAWPDLDVAFDALSGDDDGPRRPSLSSVKFPIVKRGIREIVAAMSNLRVI